MKARRKSSIVSLADRIANNPAFMARCIEGGLQGFRQAMLTALPEIMRHELREEAGRQGGTLRVYDGKVPADVRQERDERVRSLLAGGMAPELVALEARCSRAQVYIVRARAERKQSKTLP